MDEEEVHQNQDFGMMGQESGHSTREGHHRERKQSIGATISISSGGFEFDQSPVDPPSSTITFDIGSGPKIDPLFVLPWKHQEPKLKEHENDLCTTPTNSNINELSTGFYQSRSKPNNISTESCQTSSLIDSHQERHRNRSGQRLIDIVAPLAKAVNKKSFCSHDDESSDEVSSIATASPCVTPFSTPAVTPAVTPGVTPSATPAGSPTRQRKVSGVIMDPSATSMAISSYFFTKSFKSSQDQVDSIRRTEQLMEAAKIGEGSYDSKPKMAKPCKPKAKATALREMNFWAPTSM